MAANVEGFGDFGLTVSGEGDTDSPDAGTPENQPIKATDCEATPLPSPTPPPLSLEAAGPRYAQTVEVSSCISRSQERGLGLG